MFNDVCEAYECLSDRNKRACYDSLLMKKCSIEDANSIFEKFFMENQPMNESEQKMMMDLLPNKKLNYYNVLGLCRTCSMEDIKCAFKKLSMKYHPKMCPNDEEACLKFTKVCEAYNALCTVEKRKIYDTLCFNECTPNHAEKTFENFISKKCFDIG